MNAHVLVAEDDARQAEVVRRYLEASGYRASVVHGGRDAIEQARLTRPDLLILDVMMPQLNGVEVCRVLRRESNVPVLLVIALGHTDRWSWRWLAVAGAVSYPFYLLHPRIGYTMIRYAYDRTGLPVPLPSLAGPRS